MCLINKRWIFSSALLALLLSAGCATAPQPSAVRSQLLYRVHEGDSLYSRHAPVFVVEDPEKTYNLIGTPRVRVDDSGNEKVFVDPETPTFYVQQRSFETARGAYTNLIYRIHFERVPFSLFPFYIGMGRNVGLFVIITLDVQGRPLLYTTVHTCGCYLAFVPTSFMSADAFPQDWKTGRQMVYLENLPARLDYLDSSQPLLKTAILIRGGSHRLKDTWLMDEAAQSEYPVAEAHLQPLEALERLPLEDCPASSFYEGSGHREGYVRGSSKPWERLLMSWWALDWRIGEDKRLGRGKEDGPVFYTSLKPWAREASDLRDFAVFLNYWGWRL